MGKGGYLKATYSRENHVATRESLDDLERHITEYECNINALNKDVEFQQAKVREMEGVLAGIRSGDKPEKKSRMDPEYTADAIDAEIRNHLRNAHDIIEHMAKERVKLRALERILTEMRAERAKGV